MLIKFSQGMKIVNYLNTCNNKNMFYMFSVFQKIKLSAMDGNHKNINRKKYLDFLMQCVPSHQKN